jgi:hypothetical protein
MVKVSMQETFFNKYFITLVHHPLRKSSIKYFPLVLNRPKWRFITNILKSLRLFLISTVRAIAIMHHRICRTPEAAHEKTHNKDTGQLSCHGSGDES